MRVGTLPLGLEQLAARDPHHGPLPPLLMLLTVVTGLVDAVSYLALGRVFVANMTGNVVFLGFAVADAEPQQKQRTDGGAREHGDGREHAPAAARTVAPR